MEPSLYLPVFDLMNDFEQQSQESFQYIITTTEAPPNAIANSEQVILKLDGASTEGRLLKVDLT